MNDYTTFLAAIEANPTDKNFPLIFADWLDEQGSPTEMLTAALIRIPERLAGITVSKHISAAFGIPESCLPDAAFGIPLPSLPVSLTVLRVKLVHDCIAAAQQIADIVYLDWPAVQKRVAKLNREIAWLTAAAEGDVNAILAHPKIRPTLLAGGISTYTGKRKAVAEAKAKMAARTERREARKIAETARTSTSGKYAEAYAAKLIAFTVKVGESYHANVKSLYTSDRASVVQGSGNSNGYDHDAYSKAYRSKFGGAKWKNAGALVRDGNILLFTSRGTHVETIPMPGGKDRGRITFKGLLDGDIWAVEKRKVGGCRLLSRRGFKRGKLVETGLSLLVNGVWEHGATIADIRTELDRKREIAEQTVRSAKTERFVARVAKLCPGLVVTHDDGKRAGYCDAGRAAFLGRFGFDGATEMTAAHLRESNDARVEKPILEAARRVVKQRLAVA